MKTLFLTAAILLTAQFAFATGHCNTAIANEDIDKVYLSHETKKPISYQACMKNLTNAINIAVKLCDSKKIPNKSIATISATFYSQNGSLTELMSEGFYNCKHKKVVRNLASVKSKTKVKKRTTKRRRTI